MSESTHDKSCYLASDSAPETALAVRRPTTAMVPVEETTDERLIELWVHGRSPHTQRAYRADARRLLRLTGKSMAMTTLADLQWFANALEDSNSAPATVHRILSSVKSLFAFAHRVGYLPFDVARPLRLPALRNRLNERILEESEVVRLIAFQRNPRNHVLLLLLYASGIRVSEVCGLRWKDCQARGGAGQITVLGKGAKTRTILLPSSVVGKLMNLRHDASDDAPIFQSRKRRALSPSQVLRIVKRAAKDAGLSRNVVVHTLRHCHASHALDHGAPISLVQATLGHASVATTGMYLHARPAESSSTFLPL